MNNLCTLLDSLSKNPITDQQLDDIGNLIATVVRDDLGRDSKSLITNWADSNDDYIDFYFALRPDWLVGTPDGKQVKSMLAEIHRQYIQKLAAEGTAKFRLTFRSEIFVDAASEEEARDKFGSMTMGEIGQNSNFVEIVSCEKE